MTSLQPKRWLQEMSYKRIGEWAMAGGRISVKKTDIAASDSTYNHFIRSLTMLTSIQSRFLRSAHPGPLGKSLARVGFMAVLAMSAATTQMAFAQSA